MFRVGVDIGGTFTDVAFMNSETGELTIGKVLSTPSDPSSGVMNGLKELLLQLDGAGGNIENLIHGTTIVSNTLIERTGAKTALLTTEGFRDVLEARNGKRYDLYDMRARLPEPLVPRHLRLGVPERIDNAGEVVHPLDVVSAKKAIQRLIDEDVETIAVCFLHSFRNPEHEHHMRALIKELAPDIPVSLSVDVSPQIREYPRLSTTVINAYVQPKVAMYLTRLEDELAKLGFKRTVYMMFSGAITTSSVAKQIPVRITESGPAAGAVATAFLGEMLGLDQLISFDMGGTTAKICFVEDGQPTITRDFEVARVHRFRKGSGYPISLPALDMIEIGAGGGSIAWIDAMGLLKVGPQSASAEPGPACYGLGGELPTVTDANLTLGYLSPEYFLGGEMALDAEKAWHAIENKIAKPQSMETARAASGIYQVVNENMTNAARVYAAEKGKDLRRYTLVAFGGAGPVHATAIAQRLGVRQVIVPPAAGVMSAVGFLAAPLAFDFVHSYMSRLEDVEWAHVNQLFAQMKSQGIEMLKQAGVSVSDITIRCSADMRYVGQVHEITVALPSSPLTVEAVDAIQQAYDAEYERLYHRTNLGYQVECINWRMTVSGPRPSLALPESPSGTSGEVHSALKGERPVYFALSEQYHPCPVYDRYQLFEGANIRGPAIIEERESTTVVPPDGEVMVDRHLNLIVRLPSND